MGCRILEGDSGAVLYCSTTNWAFGPIFEDYEKADAFIEHCDKDPRKYSKEELKECHQQWIEEEASEAAADAAEDCKYCVENYIESRGED